MKKKKKKLLIALSAIILIAIFAAVVVQFNLLHRASAQQKRYMNEINAANAIIYYYGDMDPGKEITLNYKKVSEFTEETIGDKNNEYAYHAIVIWDFDKKMNVSNDELQYIKSLCEDNYYDLLYFGMAHFDQFKECGYYQVFSGNDECGFMYNGSCWLGRTGKEDWLNPYLVTGNWTKDEDEAYNHDDRHWMWQVAICNIETLVSSVGKGA